MDLKVTEGTKGDIVVFWIRSERIILKEKGEWDERLVLVLDLNPGIPRIQVFPPDESGENLTLNPFEKSGKDPSEEVSVVKHNSIAPFLLLILLPKSKSHLITRISCCTPNKEKRSRNCLDSSI